MITHDSNGGHSDIWDYIEALNADLADAKERIEKQEARIHELEQVVSVNGDTLDGVRNRVYALEHDTPQARQLQYEADLALADLAASGYRDDEEW